MIIWGSRGLTSVVHSGNFHCPRCSTDRPFSLKEVKNYFTLYFIPLIPMGSAGKYVECHNCGGTFAEEVMSYDPQKEQEETNSQLLRVMVMAALADGHVDTAERDEINRQFMEFAGLPVATGQLDQEIEMAQSSGATLFSYARLLESQLSPHGKALVVRIAYHVMAAGGHQSGHRDQLAQLGNALGFPQDQHVELIKHVAQPS